MPAQWLSIRHVAEGGRRKWGHGLSARKVAQRLSMSRLTVRVSAGLQLEETEVVRRIDIERAIGGKLVRIGKT